MVGIKPCDESQTSRLLFQGVWSQKGQALAVENVSFDSSDLGCFRCLLSRFRSICGVQTPAFTPGGLTALTNVFLHFTQPHRAGLKSQGL